MQLTPQNVNDVFKACLYKKNEDTSQAIDVESITMKIKFNPNRLKENYDNIRSMLDRLHPNFKKGWTFLNMCDDKDGRQWTGSQADMDKLLALGLAINKLTYMLPREVWPALPGGVPYVIYTPTEENNEKI